jgi:hypothetical protein
MQTGLSIVELAQKVQDQQAQKKDFIVDTREIALSPSGDEISFGVPEAGVPLANRAFGLTNLAHRQLGERVGIPAKYYDRLKDEAPELLAENVNHWLHEKPERRLVRTLGGNARAFLSDRYQRIDNHEIAQVALPVLLNSELGLRVTSSEITESRLYIHAVTEKVTGEITKGDVVQAGVIISNSEVGLGAVSVAPLVYRLVCSNGLIINDAKKRFNHVGKAQTEDDIYRDDTRKAEDRAVLLKVRDQIAAALDHARFAQQVEKMANLTSKEVKNPVKAIEVLSNKIGATEGEQNDILNALIKGGDLSAWGIVNAVTVQAHTATYDRAVEFETIGGNIIDLPRSEWEEVLEAA